MLRADNITCITVMLDPPGPPFSDCILQKKKQLNRSSICSETNVENECSPPLLMETNDRTPQRPKLIGQTKEHILMPIDNESIPTVRVNPFLFVSILSLTKKTLFRHPNVPHPMIMLNLSMKLHDEN